MENPGNDAGRGRRNAGQGLQTRPQFVLAADSERTRGRDAREHNVMAGRAVAQAVRTTLGPHGLDKMLVGTSGDVVITNDAATILREMDVEHPAAQMVLEVAEVQAEEVGDGTTTAVTLTGELLARAEGLLEDGLHPTTVVEGYRLAAEAAVETVADLARPVAPGDDAARDVVRTTLGGMGVGRTHSAALADDILDAVRHVRDDDGDADDVRVVSRTGGDETGTTLLEGLVCEGSAAHDGMPESVDGATVAVVDGALELPELSADVQYDVATAEALRELSEYETAALRGYTDDVVDLAIDAVFVTGAIADLVAADLAAREVLAFDDVDDDDAAAVAAATRAAVVARLRDLEPSELGRARSVRVESDGDDEAVVVSVGGDAGVATVRVRGGTDHVVEELTRAVEAGVEVAFVSTTGDGVVPGAGATEAAVAAALRDRAGGVEGREQLAVEAFADAVETIPATLAENAGLDPVDARVSLRTGADDGEPTGVVSDGGRTAVADPTEYGVLDAADAKADVLRNATEAATMLLRIDDVISAV